MSSRNCLVSTLRVVGESQVIDYPNYRLIDNGICIVELVKIPDSGEIPNPVHATVGTITFNWFEPPSDGYVRYHVTLLPRASDNRATWTTDGGNGADVVAGEGNDVDLNGFSNGDDFDLFSLWFIQGQGGADWNDDGFVTGEDFDGFLLTW